MVILLPPLLSTNGLLAFASVCVWRYDVVAAAMELLDLMLLLLWSSWITTWQCLVSPLEIFDHVPRWCCEDATMNG